MMMRVIVLCTVALASVAGMPAQSQSFTLKQALSAPFASDLAANPQLNRLGGKLRRLPHCPRASDMFAAGVDMHAVHRWQRPATWRSPVLPIQGDDDRNVPFSQTVSLARALRK